MIKHKIKIKSEIREKQTVKMASVGLLEEHIRQTPDDTAWDYSTARKKGKTYKYQDHTWLKQNQEETEKSEQFSLYECLLIKSIIKISPYQITRKNLPSLRAFKLF